LDSLNLTTYELDFQIPTFLSWHFFRLEIDMYKFGKLVMQARSPQFDTVQNNEDLYMHYTTGNFAHYGMFFMVLLFISYQKIL